jgi:predicted DNA-binding helix-hairpin-helix protein
LKRVYFSAYIPVTSSPDLPPIGSASPKLREHRLYQADWLLRFYGFAAAEILTADNPNLDYELDPKVVWALRNISFYPIEVNKASLEELLRIPGIGAISAKRIMRQRRLAAVKYDDLKKMGVVLKRARFFLTCSGKYFGDNALDPYYIQGQLTGDVRLKMIGSEETKQLSMFEDLQK